METFTGSIRISLRTEDSIASCWGADSHPVFVGNPLHDEELSKIFEKVLDRNLGKPR